MSSVLTVSHPDSRTSERRYILDQILHRWLGLDLLFVAAPRADILIEGPDGSAGPRLRIADGLLGIDDALWLGAATVPRGIPLRLAGSADFDPERLADDLALPDFGRVTVPAIVTSADGSSIDIDADLLGAAFYFLTRYEEVAAPATDRFGRYPAAASWAGRNGLIERPLVDEIVALLRACLLRLWPRLPLREPAFRVEVSHDVDLPLRHAWASPWRMLAGGARDVARGGGARQFARRIADWHAVRHRHEHARDPYNTFERLAAESERAGRRAAFYFIAEHPAGATDCHYEIDDPFIAELIGRLHRAGHEIGLHPSYNSYLDAAQTRRELQRLQAVCAAQGVQQQRWGGRQHYLRWRAPDTYRNWEAAGLDYDSTLGFAQHAGFRCGSSREFSPYDLTQRRVLRLTERPLVAMDSTLMDYMQLGASAATVDLGLRLKRQCQRHGGVFTLLWHNSNLSTDAQWRVFRALLNG